MKQPFILAFRPGSTDNRPVDPLASPRRARSVTLQDAVAGAPTLARLAQLAAESAARLAIVRPLLPPGLRDTVRPGAIEAASWCLLVPHNAAAAKIRQLAPALLAALARQGHAIDTLRVKVQRPTP